MIPAALFLAAPVWGGLELVALGLLGGVACAGGLDEAQVASEPAREVVADDTQLAAAVSRVRRRCQKLGRTRGETVEAVEDLRDLAARIGVDQRLAPLRPAAHDAQARVIAAAPQAPQQSVLGRGEPAELVDAIVTEKGIVLNPGREAMAAHLEGHG